MAYHRKKQQSEWQRKKYWRRAAIVSVCVLIVTGVIGLTYGLTRVVLQSRPAATHAVSSANTTSSGTPSTGNPTRIGDTVEVKHSGLTGYQTKYPKLYAQKKIGQWKYPEEKTVYLTFDDGPSSLTPQTLAVLKRYNIKAAFFLTNQPQQKNTIHYIRDIYKAGCVCAVHSSSHNYKKIYASVDAFLADFNEMYEVIQEQTDGHCAPFFRFPGGSNNPAMSKEVRKGIIQEMTRRGFFFYDWDADSRDAVGADAATIYANAMKAIDGDCNMILMHNSAVKTATLSQLGNIIEYGQQNGYCFKLLDGTVDPASYSFSNSYFIPLLKNSPNFKLSDHNAERFADLLGNTASSSAAGSDTNN